MEITLKNKQVIRGVYVSETALELRLFDVMAGCMKSVNRADIAALAMVSFTRGGT